MDNSQNEEKIRLKLLKDSTNNWLVNKEDKAENQENKNKQSLAAEKTEEGCTRTKHSLRVSLPVRHFNNNMKPTNESRKQEFPINRMETLRHPPPAHQAMRPPPPVSATNLRTVRHPIPTSRIRTTMSNRPDHTRFPPPANPNITTAQIYTAGANNKQKRTTQTTVAPVQGIFTYRPNETPMSCKHKLPLTVEPSKISYIKENQLNTNMTPQKITTSVTTQTEKNKVISEEDNDLLSFIKKSGITLEDLKAITLKLKKPIPSTNETEGEIIDLEKNREEKKSDSDSIINRVIKQSQRNKFILAAYAEKNKLDIIKGANISPELPESSFAVPTKVQVPPRPGTPFPKKIGFNEFVTSERVDTVLHAVAPAPNHVITQSTSNNPIIVNRTRHTSSLKNLTNNEVREYVLAIANLNKLGSRLTNSLTTSLLVEQYTQTDKFIASPICRSNLQHPTVADVPMQPQRTSSNIYQELPSSYYQTIPPPHMPQQGELLMNYGQEIPVMHYAPHPVHQQGVRHPMVYSPPYLNNGQPQVPQQPRQYFNNDPRRNSLRTPMAQAENQHRMSRVMSTDEANLHGSRVSQDADSWPYSIYDRPRHYWPERRS